MSDPRQQVVALRNYITDEIFKAIGWSPGGRLRELLEPVFRLPTQRFAEIAASFDQRVGQSGFCEAARWVLPCFVKEVEVHNQENIPEKGPLIIASNHPGTVDSLAIAASLPRNDLKIIASAIPFIKNLPDTARYLLYTPLPDEVNSRMNVVRAAIRQLKEGGTVLIFPSGRLDPDPEVLPGADQALNNWSPSLELFLRVVPQAKLLVAIVSGVLSPECLRHPFTWLRKGSHERQLLAEFIQIIQQMGLAKRFNLTPQVSFAKPTSIPELLGVENSGDLRQAIITKARQVLSTHLASYTCQFERG